MLDSQPVKPSMGPASTDVHDFIHVVLDFQARSLLRIFTSHVRNFKTRVSCVSLFRMYGILMIPSEILKNVPCSHDFDF